MVVFLQLFLMDCALNWKPLYTQGFIHDLTGSLKWIFLLVKLAICRLSWGSIFIAAIKHYVTARGKIFMYSQARLVSKWNCLSSVIVDADINKRWFKCTPEICNQTGSLQDNLYVWIIHDPFMRGNGFHSRWVLWIVKTSIGMKIFFCDLNVCKSSPLHHSWTRTCWWDLDIAFVGATQKSAFLFFVLCSFSCPIGYVHM